MAFNGAFALFAAIVLGAFTVEAAAGFGSTVLALALGVHLYSIPQLLAVIVPLNLVLELYLVVRHGAFVNRPLLGCRIIPVMGIGVAIGFAAFSVASSESLRAAFGAFVILVALRGLIAARSSDASPVRPLPPWASVSGLLAAGVTHGLFASGGPLLVYVLLRSPLDKREFRSTLAAVWLTCNAALTTVYALSGRIDAAAVGAFIALLPVVCAGIVLGEAAHQRLDEERFRFAVLVLLVVAGVLVLW